jgi:hypothetical protein
MEPLSWKITLVSRIVNPTCIVLPKMERSSGRLKSPTRTRYTHGVRFNDDGMSLSTYTINGHACDLDPKTGKILSKTSIQ